MIINYTEQKCKNCPWWEKDYSTLSKDGYWGMCHKHTLPTIEVEGNIFDTTQYKLPKTRLKKEKNNGRI